MVYFSEEGAEAGVDETPSTLILRLFLDPGHGGVSVTSKGWLDISVGEGSELLESDDGDIVDSTLLSVRFEVVIHLSTAINDLTDFVISYKFGRWVLNDSLESETDIEFFDLRVGTTELKKLLGDGDDQGFAERSSDLTAEKMEVVRGCCTVTESEVHVSHDLGFRHVISWVLVTGIAEGQEALDTTGGMLWASTIVTMGQKHYKSGLDVPLGLS